MLVILGIVILVVSFVIAFISLVRERKVLDQEQEHFDQQEAEPTKQAKEEIHEKTFVGRAQLINDLAGKIEQLSGQTEQIPTKARENQGELPRERFPWEEKIAQITPGAQLPNEAGESSPVSDQGLSAADLGNQNIAGTIDVGQLKSKAGGSKIGQNQGNGD